VDAAARRGLEIRRGLILTLALNRFVPSGVGERLIRIPRKVARGFDRWGGGAVAPRPDVGCVAILLATRVLNRGAPRPLLPRAPKTP
jgi:hypothetical protein